jgi:hypothetical protein
MRHESSKKSKKRLAVVAAVGGAMMASFGVYATTLIVNANQDAAGNKALSTVCDASGVTVSTGTPVYDSATGKYTVDKVTVTGIDATGCTGQVLYVTAAGASGTSLFADSWPIAGTGTAVLHDFTVSSPFATDALESYAVAIHQPLP